MDDSCDPFGTPYPKEETCEKKKTYSLRDLEELRQKKESMEWEIYRLNCEIEDAKKQLRESLEKYTAYDSEIEYNDHYGSWKIIATKFNLNGLDRIKEDFDLKNVKAELKTHKVNGKYKDRIIISLEF